ncbi:hypothetical protein H6F74_12830 [Trichocoleus sp. FACHB-90]|uniref:hypothetical protein n=1 Tax=Cyanophyceae TaxID=3028117 RepID=UPI001688E7C9|nr:hypothetical protein [Trichocoleus sp. FACHB-90]MBD1927122.1 hypothetical protein [Trichocoleus sp. FACHB-90]
MEQIGTVKYLRKGEGRKGFGYITPMSPIPNYDKDIVFFEDDLEDMTFESLKNGMKLEFFLEQRENKKSGLEWIARQIHTAKADVSSPVSASVIKKSSFVSASPTGSNSPSFKLLLEKFSDAFALVEQIKGSDEFEDAVFALLRLLGIHAVYQYPREAQAGRADGFFILNNLAVMYDCTLRDSFEEYKKDQIENYVNKLSNKSQLTIETRRSDGGRGSKELQIQGKSRQVWIITRGFTREMRDYDGIKVKEVAIKDLVEIAMKRCKQLSYDADNLSTELFMLGA